jgi:hypothetical protein
MKNSGGENTGLILLLQRYKKIFRIPENLDHYSKTDYQMDEKKFLKYVLAKSGI